MSSTHLPHGVNPIPNTKYNYKITVKTGRLLPAKSSPPVRSISSASYPRYVRYEQFETLGNSVFKLDLPGSSVTVKVGVRFEILGC